MTDTVADKIDRSALRIRALGQAGKESKNIAYLYANTRAGVVDPLTARCMLAQLWPAFCDQINDYWRMHGQLRIYAFITEPTLLWLEEQGLDMSTLTGPGRTGHPLISTC